MAIVLLVNHLVQELWSMQERLEAVGHRVTTARDGEEALALADLALPDVAIADPDWPLDARWLWLAWRGSGRTSHVPLLFYSGPAHGRLGVMAEDDLWLIEPVPLEAVVQAIGIAGGSTGQAIIRPTADGAAPAG